MKKVVLAIDGKNLSVGSFDFIIRMNEGQSILLTGVFLPAVEETELLYSLGGMTGPVYLPAISRLDDETEEVVKRFEELCQKNNIEYRVHNNTIDNVVEALKQESRYTDLMVIGSESFYSHLGKERQHEYLLHVLHKSECPVLLVPEKYAFPQSLVIAFDGSASSVFAMKQFSYLFPDLCSLDTIAVFSSNTKDFPNWDYVEELIARHYSNLSVTKLNLDASKYFESWVADIKNTMVVAGAYSRSFISEVLKKSFVDNIINGHSIPVFIAHV